MNLNLNSTAPLRVGVIGYGYWGPVLCRNLALLKHAELVAICDQSFEARSKANLLHKGANISASFEEMILTSNIDAVLIATPARTHFRLAADALRYGLHVLVEKPLALSSTKAEKLIQLAQQKRKTLMVDHTHLFAPAFECLSALIQSGEIGELRHASCHRAGFGLFTNCMNAAWDLASHDVSMLTSLAGEGPLTASCVGYNAIGLQPIDTTQISLRFPSGFSASIHSSWAEPRKSRKITLVGSSKMIVFDDLEPEEKITLYERQVSATSPEKFSYHIGGTYSPSLDRAEPVARMCQHFVDCCLTGSTPRTDGNHALQIISVLEASDRSLTKQGLMQPVAQHRVGEMNSKVAFKSRI